MMGSRPLVLGLWLLGMGLAAIIVARARFSADLSAFLPRVPSPTQRLLVDQLQNGLAAHLILIGIEGGDAAQRARASSALTARLSVQSAFLAVNNGEAAIEERDRVTDVVRATMEHVTELRVPLVVDIGFGTTWADAK